MSNGGNLEIFISATMGGCYVKVTRDHGQVLWAKRAGRWDIVGFPYNNVRHRICAFGSNQRLVNEQGMIEQER